MLVIFINFFSRSESKSIPSDNHLILLALQAHAELCHDDTVHHIHVHILPRADNNSRTLRDVMMNV